MWLLIFSTTGLDRAVFLVPPQVQALLEATKAGDVVAMRKVIAEPKAWSRPKI